MPDTIYKIENLTKVYGERTVLDISELSLEKGRVHALLGPNGAGKTTLLEILSFIQKPTTGRIVFDSTEVGFSRTELQVLRRRVVIIAQTPIMFTSSVAANVEFGLKVRKVPKRTRDKIVREVLELVGLQDFAQRPAHRLSGGETQRVAIARGVACSPDVLFFDEPTANVDLEHQAIIEKIMTDINREKGITVVFTTHNLIQAGKIAERTIYLQAGRPGSSMFENIFTGMVESDPKGMRFCRVQDEVRFPLSEEVSGRVRIALDPGMIRLYPLENSQPQNNGHIGRLTQATDAGPDVRLLVDIGVLVHVLIKKDLFRENGLWIGGPVRVVFPPEGIEVLKTDRPG